jgi:hypothetical protein
LEHSDQSLSDGDDSFDDYEFNFVFWKRIRNRPKISDDGDDGSDPGDDETPDSSEESSEYTTEEDMHNDSLNSNTSDHENDPYEIFENYSLPEYDEPNQPLPPSGLNGDGDKFLWILIWIMTFRTKFNISETATEALIKFMKLVLSEIGGNNFNDFPDSLYLTRKWLGLKDQYHSFVPCLKCHKLYLKQDVKNFQQEDNPAIMKCQHVEFPNSSHRRTRICNTPLSQKISLNKTKI